LPHKQFVEFFCLYKEAVQFVLEEVVMHLALGVRRTAIPNNLKVFYTLHFLGHGSYQTDVGANAFLGMSQTPVSRCTVASKKFWSSMSFQNFVRLSQINKKSLPYYAHVNKVSKKFELLLKKTTINVIQPDDRL
jgi:hypothetical protein